MPISAFLFDAYNKVSVGSSPTFAGIELSSSTPFIDFHYGRSTADYTSRIIEYASGSLSVTGNLNVSGVI